MMVVNPFVDGGRYHIETRFLYDIGLRHERVKNSSKAGNIFKVIFLSSATSSQEPDAFL